MEVNSVWREGCEQYNDLLLLHSHGLLLWTGQQATKHQVDSTFVGELKFFHCHKSSWAWNETLAGWLACEACPLSQVTRRGSKKWIDLVIVKWSRRNEMRICDEDGSLFGWILRYVGRPVRHQVRQGVANIGLILRGVVTPRFCDLVTWLVGGWPGPSNGAELIIN